ncbi:MAG: hypothetical protein GX761_03830 [Gammaproteobacteria bacterium]|nr:hypothetical protein [Gammaproteobacteria bacterium]
MRRFYGDNGAFCISRSRGRAYDPDHLNGRCGMSSFALYLIGMLVVIGGLAYGATLAGLAPHWIIVGAVVLLGIGIIGGVSRTRQKDPVD